MSTPNPVPNQALAAVSPEARAMIAAIVAFNNAMGVDPAKWAFNFPGAKLILDGTMLQQLTAMVPALGGLAITNLNSFWAGVAAKLPPAA
jgi:hypothetical protein